MHFASQSAGMQPNLTSQPVLVPIQVLYPTRDRSNRHGNAEQGAASSFRSTSQRRGRDRPHERDTRRDMTHSPSRGQHAGMRPEDEGNEYDINDRYISHDNLLRKHAQMEAATYQELQQVKDMFMQMVTKKHYAG